MSAGPRWTDEEIGYVVDHPEMNARQIGAALGRPLQGVWIIRRKIANGWAPEREPWTDSELDLLREHPEWSLAEGARQLGRGIYAVSKARTRLRLEGVDFRNPHRVGRRRLVAKTCGKCGLLLDATWFRPCGGGWAPVCARCKDRGAESQRSRPSRTGESRAAANFQRLSLETATRHRQPWLAKEHDVLSDPDLTDFEKAVRLNRTYFAVRHAVRQGGYDSKSMAKRLGDPSEAQWIIHNPNMPGAA